VGKRLLEQRQRIDTERFYTPREALELLKELEGSQVRRERRGSR
jgi:large subunit ribosomal protein L1